MGRTAVPTVCSPRGGGTFLYLHVNIKVQKLPLVHYCSLTPRDDWRYLQAFSLSVSDLNYHKTVSVKRSWVAFSHLLWLFLLVDQWLCTFKEKTLGDSASPKNYQPVRSVNMLNNRVSVIDHSCYNPSTTFTRTPIMYENWFSLMLSFFIYVPRTTAYTKQQKYQNVNAGTGTTVLFWLINQLWHTRQ